MNSRVFCIKPNRRLLSLQRKMRLKKKSRCRCCQVFLANRSTNPDLLSRIYLRILRLSAFLLVRKSPHRRLRSNLLKKNLSRPQKKIFCIKTNRKCLKTWVRVKPAWFIIPCLVANISTGTYTRLKFHNRNRSSRKIKKPQLLGMWQFKIWPRIQVKSIKAR